MEPAGRGSGLHPGKTTTERDGSRLSRALLAPSGVDLGGAYSNTKDQFRALEELREKLPSLDTPEPPSIKRDAPAAHGNSAPSKSSN